MNRNRCQHKKLNLVRQGLLAMVFFSGLIVLAPIGNATQQCPTIDEKYSQLGGSNGFLGAPISKEIVATDGIGHYRNYEKGTIYWTANTCGHELHGEVLNKYLSQDYDFSYKMGYPTTDVENSQGGGNYAYFEGGAIFWKDRTGAHALRGDILQYWENKGRENSVFGYPMTDIMPSNDMRYNVAYFEKRIIYGGTQQNPVPPFDEYYQKAEPGFNCLTAGTGSGCEIPFYPPPVITYWKIPNQPTDVYRIDGPIVWSPDMTSYPEVKFQPGDRVKFAAGGCVQTSGGILTGKTWKNYVYPDPSNLYYGMISIPGFTSGAEPINVHINKPMILEKVQGKNPEDYKLSLGYEDDGYGDNSYGYHDDGTSDQCENIGAAWVVVTVEHNPSAIITEPAKPFDYVSNAFLFNWDNVPGDDNRRLRTYLQKFNLDWTNTAAKIEKIDNGKTIRVYTDKNYLTLKLNDDKTKVNLIIDDGRFEELRVKNENGNLKIYRDSYDDNSILLNPKWGKQDEFAFPYPIFPYVREDCLNKQPQKDLENEDAWKVCTDQNPRFDLPNWWPSKYLLSYGALCHIGSDSGYPYGHINWVPGTFVSYGSPAQKGNEWDKYDSGWFLDGDYNFNLFDSSIKTEERKEYVGLEFDSAETINHFDTPWWKAFRTLVENFPDQAKYMINGKYTIVTGLVGLDGPHGGYTEVHPVWAMAIDAGEYSEGGFLKENWPMFVRNWGNEGFCSEDQHYLRLPSKTYTFRLPWKKGASSVDVDWVRSKFLTSDNRVSGPSIKYAVNEGVLVTFTLPSPTEDGPMVNGELHLKWTFPKIDSYTPMEDTSQITALQTTNELRTTNEVETPEEGEEGDVSIEDLLRDLYGQMTQEQRDTLLAHLPVKDMTSDNIVPLHGEVERVKHLQTILPGQSYMLASTDTAPAYKKRELDDQRLSAWITAYGSEDAFRNAFLQVSARAVVTREIDKHILTSGSSTTVTVTLQSNETQDLSLNETLPPGWTLTEISNSNADSFDPIKKEWKWSEVGKGETRTVVYRLDVPSDAEARTYYINGSFVDKSGFYRNVLGDREITVAAEIHGMKWEDFNGNGKKDPGDQGLTGWNITLNGTNDITGQEVNITTTTDTNGNYSFTNITAGKYIISEKLKDGWIQITPAKGTYTLTITTGTVINGQDFGNFKLGEVHGQKFEDLNANGIRDNDNFISEMGLAGWQISLTGTDTITNTPVNKTTITDGNGNYEFTGLTAGTYTVTETLQNGWVQTAPSTVTYTVTITSGTNITGQDFGNFHKGKITGGDWINITGDPKATFGITGQYPDSKSAAQGNVEYQDHITKLNIKSTRINTVATTLDKKKGAITGLAMVNGAGTYPFVVYVEDNAEPGKGADVFKISLPTYPYSNGAILNSGNILIHS